MLPDGSTRSVASSKPASADVEVQVSKGSLDGDVVVKAPPTSRTDHASKESFLDISPGAQASTHSPIPASNSGSAGRRSSPRRSGSNIASRRAAFELADASQTPVKRFEKSPSRSFPKRLENSLGRSREQDAEIARLERQLAGEIEKRVSCQRELEAQVKMEIDYRRRCQDRCEQLEKKIEECQPPRCQLSSEILNTSNDTPRDSSGERGSMSMQRQLSDLKRSISTATRVENQVSDSTFAQEILKLHHELQNFIVNAFRRVKVVKTPQELCEALGNVVAGPSLGYLRPVFEAFEPSMKLAALQATAVSLMMEIFDDPLLFGLPEQQEWQESLRKTVKTLPSVLAPATFNKWRYLTLDAVRQSASIEDSVLSAASHVSERICDTLGAITDVQDLSARASSLTSIIMRAVQLSHLFRVQQARYELALPLPGAQFLPDLMEDHAVDNETAPELVVACATFPSVVKYGGEHGNDLQLSNVVVKAKVLCRT